LENFNEIDIAAAGFYIHWFVHLIKKSRLPPEKVTRWQLYDGLPFAGPTNTSTATFNAAAANTATAAKYVFCKMLHKLWVLFHLFQWISTLRSQLHLHRSEQQSVFWNNSALK
jgi:hypothetical protein